MITLVSGLMTGLLLTSPAALGGDFPGLRYGPDTTIIETPRLPSGLPDYRRAIENRLSNGVTLDQNAWCGLSETFDPSKLDPGNLAALRKKAGFQNAGQLPFVDAPDNQASVDLFWAELELAISRAWKPDECPRVARWLEWNRRPLDSACRAVARSKAYTPIIASEETPIVFARQEHLQPARALARALSARANQSIGLGRFEDAWSDVLAGHRLARHLARGHTVIELLVGWSIAAILHEATVEAIVHTPGGPDAVADRWRALEPYLLSNIRLADKLEFERLMVLDVVLRCRASRAAIDQFFFEDPPLRNDLRLQRLPALYGEWLWRFLRWRAICLTDVNEQLQFVNQYFDEAIRVLDREGIRARVRAFNAMDRKYLEPPRMPTKYEGLRVLVHDAGGFLRRIWIMGLLRKHAMPFEHFDEGVRRNAQKNRLFLAAALAEMHYRETGRDIEAGAELVNLQKKFLPGDETLKPTDLYHKQPLRLRHVAEALVIFSVGPNGRDDEGRPWDPEKGDDDFSVQLPRRGRN